jgi:hypothetical protein
MCPVVKKIIPKTTVSGYLSLFWSAFASPKIENSKYIFFNVSKNFKTREKL